MSHPGQILIIGEFRFPEGDAASIRTMSLARVCRDLGFSMTVIGKGQLRRKDYESDLQGYYIEGIRYETMNPAPITSRQRLLRPLSRILLSASTLESLNTNDTRAIIINACDSARHVPFVSAFCKRKSIPLIADVCEWYDPRQMAYGRLNPAYYIFSAVFHYYLPRLRNFIVVSKLLERQFTGKGRNVMRIAAPFDVANVACSDKTPKDRLVLLYAGMAGRKDLLREVIVALARLSSDERSRIEFRLLGPTKQDLLSLLGKSAGVLNLLGDTVKPLGRVSREEVLQALQSAHFTILLRPDMRYANAGFPSKVAESLAAGTPVLLNFTSDLAEYLGDGAAALEIHDCSLPEVTRAIRRALQLTPTELLGLRRGARAKAEQLFDYRIYLESFRLFLGRLR